MIPEAEVGRAAADLAPVTDPDATCPVCRSGEAIRQTSCTPLVEAFSCDGCDTRWAISVVYPPSLVDREPRGFYIGRCGHRVAWIGPALYVGPREECEPSTT